MYQMLLLAKGGIHNHTPPYRPLWSCVRPRARALYILVNAILCQVRAQPFSHILFTSEEADENVSSGSVAVVFVHVLVL